MKKQTVFKGLGFLFIIVLLIWLNHSVLDIRPKTIRNWMLSFGILAPLIYIALYTVRPLILFPASILSLAGGLAFGAVLGTVYTIIGATLSAMIAFLIAKAAGPKFIKANKEGRFKKIQHQLEKNGFYYVLMMRILPIFNFDLISYAAGASRVKFLSFALATMLGIIPGTFAYNFLGSSFASGSFSTIIIAAVIFLIVLAVPIYLKKRTNVGAEIEESKE
jgi:uncharacterized membrane protein YdjX (TVP38/TMEM64 family)